MLKLEPTLHKEIPMGTRVVTPTKTMGTVIGISSMYVIFQYIVLLDEPISSEYGELRAIAVYGTELNGINGENWRLNF